MNDTITDVNDVIIGDGILGKVGKHCSLEQACVLDIDKWLKG